MTNAELLKLCEDYVDARLDYLTEPKPCIHDQVAVEMDVDRRNWMERTGERLLEAARHAIPELLDRQKRLMQLLQAAIDDPQPADLTEMIKGELSR